MRTISVRLNLGSSLSVFNKDIQYKVTVHLRLTERNYTRTEIGVAECEKAVRCIVEAREAVW